MSQGGQVIDCRSDTRRAILVHITEVVVAFDATKSDEGHIMLAQQVDTTVLALRAHDDKAIGAPAADLFSDRPPDIRFQIAGDRQIDAARCYRRRP